MTSFEQIRGNLVRQRKALELLLSLLEEEFALLREHKTDDVVALEFSIHELLRQIAVERTAMKDIMQETKVAEYASLLDPVEGDEIRELLQAIDDAEQSSARQASHNTRLSLALLDQSQELLDYLHEQVKPQTQMTYGARGAYRTHRPVAALFVGRT